MAPQKDRNNGAGPEPVAESEPEYQSDIPLTENGDAAGAAERPVNRKDGVHGPGPGTSLMKRRTRRWQTGRDIYDRDPGILYARTGRAIRNRVCSLVERQDRMNMEILLKINDPAIRLREPGSVPATLTPTNGERGKA
jgi:hypothetical protein